MANSQLFSLPESLLEASFAFLDVLDTARCVRASRFLLREAAQTLNRLALCWVRRRYGRLWESSLRAVQTSSGMGMSPYATLMCVLGQEHTLLCALARVAAHVAHDAAGPTMSAELAKWSAPMPHALLMLHRLTEFKAAPESALVALAPFREWLLRSNPTQAGDATLEEKLQPTAAFVWHLATTEATLAAWRRLLAESDAGNHDMVDVSTVSLAAARAGVVAVAAAEADASSTDEDVGAAALRLMGQGGGVAEGMVVLAAWRDPAASIDALQPIVAEIACRCWRKLGLVTLNEAIEPSPLPLCPRTGAARPALVPPHHFPSLVKCLGVRGIAALQRASEERGTLAVLRCVASVLFQELGFRGAVEDEYYDPRNSFLDQVLLLRRGIPISLAGVFSLCCGAVGLLQPLAATNMPFHFLLAVRLSSNDRLEGDAWAAAQPQASPVAEEAAAAAQASAASAGGGIERMVCVDAYSGGSLLTGGQALEMVAHRGRAPQPEYLAPVSRFEVWRRCLRNLQGIYKAPGPVRSIENLRLYGALSQTIALSPDIVMAEEITGVCLEALEARISRWNFVSEFAFSVAAADLSMLVQMAQQSIDFLGPHEAQQLALMRGTLLVKISAAAAALRLTAGATAVEGLAVIYSNGEDPPNVAEENLAAAAAATEAFARLALWGGT
jgi:hypothetical protein